MSGLHHTRWDQEPWFTGTMVIVTEQKMTKYRTIVSSRMGSDFNEKTNQVQIQKEQGEIYLFRGVSVVQEGN